MNKSKIAVFALVSVFMLTVLWAFSRVTDNYTSQNTNTLKTFQKIIYNREHIEDDEKTGSSLQEESSDQQYIITDDGTRLPAYSAIKSSHIPVTFSDYQDYLKMYEDLQDTAVYSELEETTVKDKSVTPVLINENYLNYSSISYTGEGITRQMTDKKQRAAVISRTFAQKYFYGESYINKTFKMNGVRYKVTGVYDDKNQRLNNFFKDGRERIYICYTGVDGYETREIDYIGAVEGTRAAQQLSMADFMGLTGINYSEKNLAVHSFGCIILFVLSLTAIVYLMRLWVYGVCSTGRFLKQKNKAYYAGGLVIHNAGQLALRFLVLAGLPALMAGLVILSFKDFHIVSYYIDKENLFSVSAMLENLISVMQRENTFVYGGNPYFINLYRGTMLILPVAMVVFFALFAFWFYSFINLSKKFRRTKPAVIILFFAMGVSSMISCFAEGTSNIFWISVTLLTLIMFLIYVRDRIKTADNQAAKCPPPD